MAVTFTFTPSTDYFITGALILDTPSGTGGFPISSGEATRPYGRIRGR